MNGWISLQFLTVSNLSSGAHTYMLAPHLVFYLRHHDCADDAPAALLAVSMCAAGIHSPLSPPLLPLMHRRSLLSADPQAFAYLLRRYLSIRTSAVRHS